MEKTIEIKRSEEDEKGILVRLKGEKLGEEEAIEILCRLLALVGGRIKPEHIFGLLGDRMDFIWDLIFSKRRECGYLNEEMTSKIIRQFLYDMKRLPDKNSADLFSCGFFNAIDPLAEKMTDAIEKRCHNPEWDCYLRGNCPGNCNPS